MCFIALNCKVLNSTLQPPLADCLYSGYGYLEAVAYALEMLHEAFPTVIGCWVRGKKGIINRHQLLEFLWGFFVVFF